MTLTVALTLDWLVGDPRSRLHPVALYGRLVGAIEHRLYRDRRSAGVAGWCLAVVPLTFLVDLGLHGLERIDRHAEMLLGALCIWASIGWRSLLEHVRRVSDAPDLPTSRARVAEIVGRDVQQATPVDVRRAALESLAENAADGVVAPLLWAHAFGPAGAVAYRCINTLDARWGHRTPRFRRFGWAAARADDIASWIPSRVCGLAILVVGGRLPSLAWIRDARAHASPNAGWPEAALARVLCVRLGGEVRRGGSIEPRAWVGPCNAREPRPDDLARGLRVTHRALLLIAALAIAGEWTCT